MKLCEVVCVYSLGILAKGTPTHVNSVILSGTATAAVSAAAVLAVAPAML